MPPTPRRRASACLFLLLLSLLAVVPSTSTAAARAGADLSISPQHYVGGQRLTFAGNIGARGERRVKLQINLSRPGDEWKDVDDFRGTTTQRNGDFSFGYTAPSMFGIRMRVASGRLTTPPITFQAESQDLVIEAEDQDSRQAPQAGQAFEVRVDTTPNSDGERDLVRRTDLPPPAFPGRVLTLQRRAVEQSSVPSYTDQWTTVATTTANAQGKGVFTGLSTDADTVYRVRQERWTQGGSKIGWYPSYPLLVDVADGVSRVRSTAATTAERSTARTSSRTVAFKDVASVTAAETFQWRPALWDWGWTYGESLSDGPSRGTYADGEWVDWADGTGRAAKHNGGVMLDTQRQNSDEPKYDDSYGSTAITLRDAPMKYGRWEVRLRTKSTETGEVDPRVLVELVPDAAGSYGCGNRNITVAEFVPHGSAVKIGAKNGGSRWDRTVRDAWTNGASKAFAVEVTRSHISWFIEGRIVGTVRNESAISDVPLTLRLSLAGQGQAAVNRTQAISDWQRAYSLERGAQKTNGATLAQSNLGGC